MAATIGPALQEFARTHLPDLIRHSYRILGSMHDAEDVLQEVFRELLSKPPGDVKNLPALLHHVVTCRSLDQLRRRKTIEPYPNDPPGKEPSPSTAICQAEWAEQLRQAIATLTPRESEVFTLRHISEKPNQEIAGLLGISENAVAVILRKAKSRLQTLFDKEHPHVTSG